MNFGIIDIIIIGLSGLLILIGLVKGFAKQIMSFASGIVGIILTALLVSPVSTLVINSSLFDTVADKINTFLLGKDPLFAEVIVETTATTQVSGAMTGLGIPAFISDLIVKVIGDNPEAAAGSSIASFLSLAFGRIVIVVATFIVLLIVITIILKLVTKMIDKLFNFSFMGIFNRLFGALLGAIKALIIVSVIMFGLSFAMTVPFISSLIGDFLATDMGLGTEGFGVAKFLYENNPIQLIISGSFNFEDILNSLRESLGG